MPESKFYEVLPESCPPESAQRVTGKYARLLESDEISDHCFDSNSKLGKPIRSKIDPCVWAACSLLKVDENLEDRLRAARDFAKLKGLSKHRKFAAIVSIGPRDGVALLGDDSSPHISFWMYADFNIDEAIEEIVEL